MIFGFGTLAGTVVTGSGLSPLPSLIAIAGWLAALWMARRAARIDPYYFRIRYRLRKYDRYWPARPTPFGARKNKMKGV